MHSEIEGPGRERGLGRAKCAASMSPHGHNPPRRIVKSGHVGVPNVAPKIGATLGCETQRRWRSRFRTPQGNSGLSISPTTSDKLKKACSIDFPQ